MLGLLGISGASNDMQNLVQRYNSDDRVKLAIDMFVYRVRKYIGAFAAVLGGTRITNCLARSNYFLGVDCLIFTGGIGENSPDIRDLVCKDLEFLGVSINAEKNKHGIQGKEKLAFICDDDARCKIAIVNTNEELIIAKETFRMVRIHQSKSGLY